MTSCATLPETSVSVVRKTSESGRVATHGLLVHPATERHAVQSIAPLLADAIGRLHRDQDLDDLLIYS